MKKPKKSQSEKFIETAKKLGAMTTKEEFETNLKKLISSKKKK